MEKFDKNPSKGLKSDAKRFFLQVRKDYSIEDPLGLYYLGLAAHHFQRVLEARKIIRSEGAITTDRWGQRKEHPACTVERGASAEMRACLKSLNLDIEQLNPTPGRPPGPGKGVQ